MKKVNLQGTPFHFIGIGGIGMSALAYVVAKKNLRVSGSDVKTNRITDRLESLGAKIFSSQKSSNLDFVRVEKKLPVTSSVGMGSVATSVKESRKIENNIFTLPQVICSTAISPDNPEYQAAVELGCPIFHRSDLLAALIDEYDSIAVSGTHGKTTTSSAIAYVLLKGGLDPTIIVGGEVDTWSGNARFGESKYLVAEADESDGTLVKHSPSIGVVTNIELDHPDRYKDIEEVIDIFKTFSKQCEIVVACLDDPVIRDNIKFNISYSLNPETNADYTVKNIVYHGEGSEAEVWEKGECLGNLSLKLLGEHNLSNSLAVIAVGRKLGLEFSVIAEGLATFTGTKRRFELKGEINGIKLIDDYAHHPKEISVTLKAASLKTKDDPNTKRVVAIFQPHRYSRTEVFMKEFAMAFADADIVVITDIYSAGEKNINNINVEQLVAKIPLDRQQVYYHKDLKTLPQFLKEEILQSGDLAMFLGAGNLNQTIPKIIDLYK